MRTVRCSAFTARCTFRMIRYITKNFISLRAIWGSRISRRSSARIGVLVCWDQWYPEGARITALQGANVLFYPTAIGWHPSEKAQYGEAQLDAWRTIQRAHAIANGIFVAAVNRIGFEGTRRRSGLEFWGNSFVADPFGQVIAQGSAG